MKKLIFNLWASVKALFLSQGADAGSNISRSSATEIKIISIEENPVIMRKTVKTHTLNGRCRTVGIGEKTGK